MLGPFLWLSSTDFFQGGQNLLLYKFFKLIFLLFSDQISEGAKVSAGRWTTLLWKKASFLTSYNLSFPSEYNSHFVTHGPEKTNRNFG